MIQQQAVLLSSQQDDSSIMRFLLEAVSIILILQIADGDADTRSFIEAKMYFYLYLCKMETCGA